MHNNYICRSLVKSKIKMNNECLVIILSHQIYRTAEGAIKRFIITNNNNKYNKQKRQLITK
jgi:hypothetical protein